MTKKQYAVNLGDMMQDQIITQLLIKPKLTEEVVKAEKNFDGQAVLLKGTDEEIKSIIDVVRLKYHRNRFRFYESQPKGVWKRI